LSYRGLLTTTFRLYSIVVLRQIECAPNFGTHPVKLAQIIS